MSTLILIFLVLSGLNVGENGEGIMGAVSSLFSLVILVCLICAAAIEFGFIPSH